ncbi:LuxR family transcriptional regulator [Rhizobiaceae bacterium n13]|uniref:LuxR family transcriptional regulator n=1 Tax=Ferirhizobium litorale TaxID=2927786 RepID=A0AAE3QDP8_9HYPH|nr:LuxR family transcriptional regulator [Fererhizobium litorale]MDI7861519.1 LuxR family transcriptional regulator [Fererhizobium litorale]MDI7921665.1 LuxR family transcriptional regulator [Fererhizobium litorale]
MALAEDGPDCAFDIERHVEEISGLRTQFDVFRFMRKLTEAYGARAFMVLNLPAASACEFASSTVLSSWPAEMLAICDQEGLGAESPVLDHLRRSTLPFVVNVPELAKGRRDGKDELVIALCERFRLPRGACFPTFDASGMRGAVSFMGDRELFSFRETMELGFFAQHIYDRLAEIRKQDAKVTDTLTEREIDCLTWTAAGKTSVEISEILSLSEHTVNHYLNRAAKKLDTVNRTQAVARALRIGLIK